MSAAPAAVPAERNPHLGSGLALAALGAIAFSGKAIIAKLAYRHGVDAVTLVMYRMLFALPLFVLIAWWAGRGKPPLTARDWRLVAMLGFFGYYLASTLDFAGLQYVSVSLERLMLYLNPTLVLLLSLVIYRRPIRARQVAAMAVSYIGIALVFAHEMALDAPHIGLGAALVFASAVSYALYLAVSGEEVKRLGSMRLTGAASSVACVLCIVQFLLLKPMAAATAVAPPVLWLSLLNAVACTVAPILMVMMAIERIGAPLAAQTGMVGPLSTIALGALILGEPFTAWAFAGTAFVLAGIWMLARVR